tara:strand:+ start:238 stop:516 length:279 start_codon:yes stop_codon:yes gene_type:complete
MISTKKTLSSEFIKCRSIWFLFLIELDWNPKALNPLDRIPESFFPVVIDLLIKAKYIGQNQEFYLNESRKYMKYLSKGGKPSKKILSDNLNA